MTDLRDINHGHMFCGLGGGAKGFNAGEARVGSMVGRFVCRGGIDVDPAACRDFERLAGAPAACMDLFSREQYAAFHGRQPPPGWAEVTPAGIRAFFRDHLHILFLSAPCKGFSGLLAEAKSKSAKYAALNGLTLRGVWLALEAFADDPVELIVFENVPRIATRGRHLLDQIVALLRAYGYQVAETKHDCGEIGGLAQSRKRFLLVARYAERVPPFLYEPPKRRLKGVGEVIGRLPVPGPWMGPDAALPMHRMPSLQWKTWVRLAFVEAGSDWRSLNRLAVEGGHLRDFGIAPDASPHNGAHGVHRWQDPAGTVTSNGRPASGAFSVADPRIDGHERSVQMGVGHWDQPAAVVKGDVSVGTGRYAVADPRPEAFRGGREHYEGGGHYGVVPWDEPSRTVAASSQIDNGFWSVADRRIGDAGQCGVARRAPAGEAGPEQGQPGLSGPGDAGVGRHGPRRPSGAQGEEGGGGAGGAAASLILPAPEDRLVAVIRALDGTWHRPFTTLELAALQGLVDAEETLELEGQSDSAWRERIGNAVPPPAAKAIAGVMGRTLLLAWSGETFMLSAEPIWVRDVAVALSVDQAGVAG